jgi:hypothetical protein
MLPFCETSDFASECSAQVHIPKNALDTAEGSVEGQGDARADAVGSARFTFETLADDREAASTMRVKRLSSRGS